MAVALVSILAQDRVGLVSEIADHLFEAGVNLLLEALRKLLAPDATVHDVFR